MQGDCRATSFGEDLSWSDFHDEMRPPGRLVPASFAELDVLKPRYPTPRPQDIEQALQQLKLPYTSLTTEDVSVFRKHRWIRLKRVIPAPLLLAARERVIKLATAATAGKNISFPDDSIFTDGFYPDEPEEYWDLISEPATQSWNIQMVWAVDPLVRALVCSPRIGDVVCALLGCEGVRLYHDNCLSRAPGSKHTRWHCDDGPGRYMAMAPSEVLGQRAVTVWYPLQGQTGPDKGSIIFATPPAAQEERCWEEEGRNVNAFDVAAMEGCPQVEQSDEYDAFVTHALEALGCGLSSATYELGDVSVHYTDCFHTSGPNLTHSPRMIIGVTYFADGSVMRVGASGAPIPSSYSKFCPGCLGGEVIATPLNPLLPHCEIEEYDVSIVAAAQQLVLVAAAAVTATTTVVGDPTASTIADVAPDVVSL